MTPPATPIDGASVAVDVIMSTVRSRSSDVALLRSDRFATFCRCERIQVASFRSTFLLLVLISVQRSTTFSVAAELPVASANEYQTNVNVDASASTELQTTTMTTTSLLPTHHSSSWSTEGGLRLPPAYRKQLPKKVLDGISNYDLENVSQSSLEAEFVDISRTTLSNEVVDGASYATTAAIEVAPAAGVMSGRTRKLPEAIIIGVKKGGTRALLEFLKIHPDIRAPGPEIHYFDRFYDKGLEWYRSRMPPTLPGQLTVEKTPSYFVTRSAPQRVYRSMPRDIRLIVVVRDPVTRALSDYTQGLVKRPGLLPFERMAFSAPSTLPGGGVNASSTSPLSSSTPARVTSQSVNISWGAIRIGLYARHLSRWLRWFPLDRFHFVSGERLVEDPAGEIGRLEDFLGVQRVVTSDHFYFNVTKGFPCLKKSEARAVPRCLGQAKGRAHPVVDPVAIERLRRFFRPYNRKFYEMTGIDFGWQ